jgi:hypothetical protein
MALSVSVLAILLPPVTAYASSSAHYQIIEQYVGNGGLANSSSANYSSVSSIGSSISGTGGTELGTLYQQAVGYITPKDPTLAFSVNTSNVNLGTLSPGSTATAQASFSVLNYTSYGYTIQVIGSPPKSGSHTLANISSASSSTAGTEQFGMNLMANTSPTVGTAVAQVPSSSFSNGSPATGYNTLNKFQYNSGDTIAQATKSSGQTNYTASYIANVSATTPGGTYATSQVFVCTGTY